MATFRDDIARAGKRLLESATERAGVEIVKADELQLLESDRSELRLAQKTLHHIGWELLNYQPGDPGGPGGSELRADVRRWAARQSLVAWLEDPLAGQSVDLYVSFVLGRGVPTAKAHDPEVQAHLDATWEDPANQRILTSYPALVEKAIDLCIQSTVAFTFFDGGEDGMCRASLLSFDSIDDAIRHDELAQSGRGDRFRILYIKARERTVRYDFATGRRDSLAEPQVGQTAKTVFYETFGAFDDENPVMSIQDEGLAKPLEAQLRPGKVYLLTVNKTSEMAFGVPRMRRLVNWMNAYNGMLKSFEDRMKAMASIYMKATVKGGQRDLDRLGNMAMGRTPAFSQAPDGEQRVRAPHSPGIIGTNEALGYEPFKIDSGAGDVSAAAPIMRSQVTGPWPDGYLSGAAAAQVAGAQSLELPTLKFVEREQKLFIDAFKAFGKSSVDAAVRVGDISEWRDPTQAELDQIALAEEAAEPVPFEVNEDGQIKRDLDFEINMPSPLKRAMLDIVSAAVQTATAVDPNATNPELSRWLFATILSEAFDVENPMRIVDDVLPRHAEPEVDPNAPVIDPATGLPVEGSTGPDGKQHPADNPAGAPQKAPQPEQRKVQESILLEAEMWRDHLAPLELSPLEIPVALNGNGNGQH